MIVCLFIFNLVLLVLQEERHRREISELKRLRRLDNAFTDKRLEQVENAVYELRGDRETAERLRAEKRHVRLVRRGEAL